MTIRIKNMYKIPVKIYASDPGLKQICRTYKPEVGIFEGQDYSVLIGSAQSKAEKMFYKKYPGHCITAIEIDLDKKKFSYKAKVNTETKKPRVRRLPFPKTTAMDYVTILGTDSTGRTIIDTGDGIIYLYPNERLSILKINPIEKRFIITSYSNRKLEYIKILSKNVNGAPVLVKWTLESVLKRKPEYVEQLNGENRYRSDNWLSKKDWRVCYRIAKKKFKKYLKEVKKDGEENISQMVEHSY